MRRPMKPLLFVAALAASLAGLVAAGAAEDVQAIVARKNLAFGQSLLRGNATACAAAFALDGEILSPAEPIIRGRAAILKKYAKTLATTTFTQASLQTSELKVGGDTAYEIGHFTMHFKDSGNADSPETLTGRYVRIWRRVGNDWLIGVDAAQPGAPAP
jgi:ketosteroid isomerase-like protein